MESILVCRLSALGDVVLALPVVEALRERFPGARLEFLSREPFGRILAGVRSLDALHFWKGPGEPLPGAVRQQRWDLVADLSATGRSRRLLGALRAARRVRARKQTLRRWAFVKLRPLGGGAIPIAGAIDRMFAALAPLGIERGGRAPRLEVPPPRRGALVLLAPGAARDAKRWPAERFRELAARLAAAGRGVLVAGAGAEEALLREVVAGAGPRGELLAGPDPAELPGVFARCAVAVTNDSGLLHVAEACGRPVVALFGPTHPRLGFAPLRADSLALRTGIGCSPCDAHGPERCPRRHHRCLREIPVERVAREVLARLARAEGS